MIFVSMKMMMMFVMMMIMMIFMMMIMMMVFVILMLITTCEMKARTVGRCESRFSPGMSVTCEVRRCP